MLKLVISLVITMSSFLSLAFLSNANEITQLNPVKTLSIKSQHLKQPFSLNVTLPESYTTAPNKRYPILFNLHPRSQPYLSGMQDWLSHNGARPWLETIVVTPATEHQEFLTFLDEAAKTPDNQQILDVLERDMLAMVDKHFRTNGYRVYAGFTRNGSIGLYALLNRPDLFNAYIISSPRLANDYLSISSQVKQKLPTLTDKIRVLYLASGEHRFEQADAASFAQLGKDLTKYAPSKLEWVSNIDPSYYMARPLINTIQGMEHVFKDYYQVLSADSDISKQGANAIIAHYKNVSENRYGFEVPAESSLRALAYSLIDSSTEEALSILTKITVMYPDSANAFHSLAAGYAHIKDYDNAVKYQKVAVEKSTNMAEWFQRRLKQALMQYQSAVPE